MSRLDLRPGATSATMSVAAHGMAGGSIPSERSMVLLTLGCAVVK